MQAKPAHQILVAAIKMKRRRGDIKRRHDAPRGWAAAERLGKRSQGIAA